MMEVPDEVRDLETIPILVLSHILLPFETPPDAIHLTEAKHLQLIDDAAFGGHYFGFHFDWLTEYPTKQRNTPRVPIINSTGCIAEVIEETAHPDGGANVRFRGIHRYQIVQLLDTDKPYPIARIKFFKDVSHSGDEAKAQALCDEICLIQQRVLTKILRKADANRDYEAPLMKPDPYFLSFIAARLFNGDLAYFLKFLQYNSVNFRLAYALEQIQKFEAAVDDNIERTELIKPFLNVPNNRYNPDLS